MDTDTMTTGMTDTGTSTLDTPAGGNTEANAKALAEANAAFASGAETHALQERVDALQFENAELKRNLAAANDLVDAANKAAKASKPGLFRRATSASASPRKIGPLDKSMDADAITDALKKADADEKTAEIAFSDGTMEIAGLDPVTIRGDVFRAHPRGTMLRDPVTVTGPASGEAPFAIAGYGLMIDGKQVAWCPRSEPVNVAAGQSIRLQDDIVF